MDGDPNYCNPESVPENLLNPDFAVKPKSPI